MKNEFKLGVIGAGFMSTAIVSRIVSVGLIKPSDIIVSDINNDNLNKMSKFGVNVTSNNVSLVNSSEFVLFAVKPQNISYLLDEINGCSCDKFISIMAGVKKENIKRVFPRSKVARCMPNTPCSIGCGAVGIDLTDYTDENDATFIKSLFESLAEVVVVNEDKLNAVTGISGSAPAYFYLFLKGIVNSGIEQGLTENEAKRLATQTMIGAGKMVFNNFDKEIDDLITAVCSKGGTTIEAIKIYNENDLENITKQAVSACVKRAEELENSL